MYRALTPKVLVYILAGPVLIAFLGLICWAPPTGLMDWGAHALKALSAGALVVGVVAGVPPLWRIFYRLTRAHEWFYPDLSGTWEGETRSNFPLLQSLTKAAVRETEAFDAARAEWEPRVTPVTLHITVSLFAMTMRMDPAEASSGVAEVLIPEPGHNGLPHRLGYVFEGEVHDRALTDEESYWGAARLTYRREGEDEVLEGPYWTNRAWVTGLNTSGRIQLRRRRR